MLYRYRLFCIKVTAWARVKGSIFMDIPFFHKFWIFLALGD